MELENCKCIKVTKPDFLGGKLNIFKKKLYGPLLWVGFNCLKARATSRRQFTFYHSVPRNSWYWCYGSRKDERLNQSWNHPVVLNTGPLEWESNALTTRPLLLAFCKTGLKWSYLWLFDILGKLHVEEKHLLNEFFITFHLIICPCFSILLLILYFKFGSKIHKYLSCQRKHVMKEISDVNCIKPITISVSFQETYSFITRTKFQNYHRIFLSKLTIFVTIGL